MQTSEDSIRLLLKPFICLGMSHFPSCATVTLPGCQSSICSTLVGTWLSFYRVLHCPIHPQESHRCLILRNVVIRFVKLLFSTREWLQEKPVKQGKNLHWNKKRKHTGCFLPLSSFVMHGTKAREGFQGRGFRHVCSIDWLTSLHSDHFHIEGWARHRHNGAHFPCSQCGHAAVGCLLRKQAHTQALCQGKGWRERETCWREAQTETRCGRRRRRRREGRKVEGRGMDGVEGERNSDKGE